MPGIRATVRTSPEVALRTLEDEGQQNLPLLRQIVAAVCQLGPCYVGDPNATRALAIQAIDARGQHTPQFFAVLTEDRKGLHTSVGPKGFSVQIAFRNDSNVRPLGKDWKSDRFDYMKSMQTWWRNDLADGEAVDLDSIIADVQRARNTFVIERG